MEKKLIFVNDIISLAQVSINDFSISGTFIVASVIEKTTKRDKPYFYLTLRDKTGDMRTRRFTRNEIEYESLKETYSLGNLVKIEGIYQNEWDSVKITGEKLLESSDYDLYDFEEVKDIDIDKLISTLMDTIKSIQNDYLKALLTLIFGNNKIRKDFFECPASVGMHHSYKHGTLEHTVNIIKLYQALEENYTNSYKLDRDLVYTGIILHDIGKTKEYSVKNGIPIRNRGYGLIGHFSLGVKIVLDYINKIDNFPEELDWKVQHLILSHHGRKEFGSQIEPQIPEAEILHLLDFLDAKRAGLTA